MKALSWSPTTQRLVLVAGLVLVVLGVLFPFLPFSTNVGGDDARCPGVFSSATIESGEFVEIPDETFAVARTWASSEVYGYYAGCRSEGRTRILLSGGMVLIGGVLILLTHMARKAEKIGGPNASAAS